MRESELQTDILKGLLNHPMVAWAEVNTSATVKGRNGHWMTIGFVGKSDITGQLKDGRLFAIEVKLPGEFPTTEQMDFLAKVADHNGVSGWATSVTEAFLIITRAYRNPNTLIEEDMPEPLDYEEVAPLDFEDPE